MLLDILRGIGIISVVIGHAIQVNLMDGDKCLIWSLILAYEMPLLFMLSGYSAGYSYPIDNLSQFIKKKSMEIFGSIYCLDDGVLYS